MIQNARAYLMMVKPNRAVTVIEHIDQMTKALLDYRHIEESL